MAMLVGCLLPGRATLAQQWTPEKPIEMIVAYGRGGGSDQMARTIQEIVAAYRLSPQPIMVVNVPAGGGGEAMLQLRATSGDPHRLLVISAGLFMMPLSLPAAASWRDFTPVALLGHDQFLLWTHAQAGFRDAADLLAAARRSPSPRIGGGGSRREDHMIAMALAAEARGRFAYVPYSGGHAASAQLAGRQLEATTGNPADEIAAWKAGTVRPLCVLSPQRIAQPGPVAGGTAWADVPTCAEQGVAFTYTMLRAVFLPGRVTAAQQRFYVELFGRIVAAPEWATFVEHAALLADFRTGEALTHFLAGDETRHRELMATAGFLAK